VVRELGLERRETVRSLSTVSAIELRKPNLSTRGLGREYQWFIGYFFKSIAETLRIIFIIAEEI